MDINGFSLDQEFFGFNQYNRSPKSNLDFMYFTKIEETAEYKKALRDHKDMIDNIKESGLPQADIDKQVKEEEKRFNNEVLKIKGQSVVDTTEKASSTFGSLFDKATSALGITQPSPSNNQAPINISYNKSQNGGSSDNKVGWIVGGILVVGIAGFVIYKMKK